jgi:hypothetical protein
MRAASAPSNLCDPTSCRITELNSTAALACQKMAASV